MNYPCLFSPGKIASLEIPNRFVMTPVQTRGCDPAGYVTRELVAFHRARSHDGKGPGLVIAQQSFAWPEVRPARGLALWDDRYIEKLSGLASAIKAGGSRAVLQLGGSGSRLAGINIAPSPVIGSWNMKRPREITRDEMMHYLNCYAEAAGRACQAGFEGISLHAGAGKYLCQFLSPWSNRRTDEFGGSPRNRVRYLSMIVDAIRERTRPDFPVVLRAICAEHTEGGLDIEEGIEQFALLAEHGVDAFIPACSAQESLWHDEINETSGEIPVLADIAVLRKALPDIVIIAGSDIHDPKLAERLLAENRADFIGICRPLLADPDFVDKVRQGREEDIRTCLRCHNCGTWDARPHLSERGICCTVNAALMVEESMTPRAASPRKRVAVVGGGLAGMSAAATLAERGHQVFLHEKSGELGGQWLAASASEKKKSLRPVLGDLVRRMEKAGVCIRLHSSPDREAVLADRVDAVILATGARPRPLTGVDILPGPRGSVIPQIFGIDFLRGAAVPGKRAAVIGGRYIGMECAIALAEQGHETSIVEMAELGHGVVQRTRSRLFMRMMELGIRVFPNSSVFRITSQALEIAHGGSVLPLKTDAVILAIGTVPDTSLQEHDFGVPTYTVGDCGRIGDARESIAQGVELGIRLFA